jgi:hypothetical protein
MSRAAGRGRNHTRPSATGDPGPGSPAGKDIGESARQDPSGSPIPGLTGNILNHETTRSEPATGEPMDQFRGWMAHGVPHEADTTEERAQAERGGPNEARSRRPPQPPGRPRPVPVPVYLVEEDGGPAAYLTASPRHVTVPANTGADPVRLCGRSPGRKRIGLLNEDTATNVRFALRPSDLTGGGGALLPYPTNSYLWLDTQDELYACTVSATLAVVVSVIEVFEQEL